MNRPDLQQLAEVRVGEAESLLRASFHDGAYYLARYAVECALKACIAKRTREHDFPDKRIVDQAHTHNLAKLVGVADLERALRRKIREDQKFQLNWLIVKDWTEEARYQRRSELEARDLYNAIIDPEAGVLTWLRDHW